MLKKQKMLCHCLFCVALGVCLICCISCGVKKSVTTDQGYAVPTDSAYRKAVIHHFEADQNLIKKHPNADVLCENATFQELLQIGTIPMIVKTASSSSLREPDTIILKVRLTYVLETKQLHGKMKTGPAIMTAQVRLIDASTGKTVHEKHIALADQPAIKSTEDPSELGKLIARHVSQVVQIK